MPEKSGQTGLLIPSSGDTLLGTLFTAAGSGLKPTAFLLHGIPGIEKNYDLAHLLRENGWNAVIFHYRGCWGSGGAYSIPDIPADVSAAIDAVTGEFPIVDPHKIVLIGHSLGGWAAVLATARDERVRALCIIGAVLENAGFNLSDPSYAASFSPWLSVTSKELARQWASLGPADDPIAVAPGLRALPTLVLHGELDTAVDKQQSIHFSGALTFPHTLEIVSGADHSFIWRRAWLQDRILDWCTGLDWEQL